MLDVGIILVVTSWHGAQLVISWLTMFAICCSSTGIERKIEGEEPKVPIGLKIIHWIGNCRPY